MIRLLNNFFNSANMIGIYCKIKKSGQRKLTNIVNKYSKSFQNNKAPNLESN